MRPKVLHVFISESFIKMGNRKMLVTHNFCVLVCNVSKRLSKSVNMRSEKFDKYEKKCYNVINN